MEKLLNPRADVAVRSNEGTTALMAAASQGRPAPLEMLLSQGGLRIGGNTVRDEYSQGRIDAVHN